MPAIPIGDFRAEVAALYAATRAPKTAQKMRQVLRIVATVPGVVSTSDLDARAVAAFLAALSERHANTRATLASYLRRACSYAVARQYLAASPFAWGGFIRPVEARGPAVHTPAAIARVLEALARAASRDEPAARRLHVWASVLAHTGLRRDEALFLERDDVELAAGLIQVRRRLKRPTARRAVPIGPELLPVLTTWLAAHAGRFVFPNRRGSAPWHGGSPGYRPTDRLRAAGELAGITGFTPASLRHSFATAAATRWGIAPALLQRLMGHTDIRTTMRYYVHVDHQRLIEASGLIRFGAAVA
jgi:integrase